MLFSLIFHNSNYKICHMYVDGNKINVHAKKIYKIYKIYKILNLFSF